MAVVLAETAGVVNICALAVVDEGVDGVTTGGREERGEETVWL